MIVYSARICLVFYLNEEDDFRIDILVPKVFSQIYANKMLESFFLVVNHLVFRDTL